MKRGRLRPALCAGLTSLVLASGAHAAGDAAPDPETAKYTLMKLKADTAKSEADAAKSQLDLVPDSGNSGKTTVQDGAGKGEAAILSAKAIDKAAAQIAGKFNTGSGHVLIIAGTTRPQIMDWLVYVSNASASQRPSPGLSAITTPSWAGSYPVQVRISPSSRPFRASLARWAPPPS